MSRHVVDLLPQHVDGCLSGARAQEVEDHLRSCSACAEALQAERHARTALAALPIVPTPAGAFEDVETALHHVAGARVRRFRGALLAAAAVAAVALVALVRPGALGGEGFRVDVLAGQPLVGDVALAADSVLPVGAELETDMVSRARVSMDIGRVDVGPGSRLAVLDDGIVRRLALRHGSISAQVLAPPRLFVVETPSATAVDLGCAYRIDVDAAGNGRLVVTSGRVSLERDGRDVLVPAGAECSLRPGRGPGVPCFRDAPLALRDALERLESSGASGEPLAWDAALAAARPRDTLALFHALPLVEPALREPIAARIAELAPSLRRADVAALRELDPSALRQARRRLEKSWQRFAAEETTDPVLEDLP